MHDFGACLKQLLEDKNISASELARKMNYKSRNTVFRILDGVSGYTTCLAFYERLIELDPLSLTAAERAQMEEALEISRVGLAAYRSNAAMRELLIKAAATDVPLTPGSVGFSEELVRRLTAARELQMTIFGCCDRRIFEWLRKRLPRRGAERTVQIKHFIYMGDEEIISAISAIQPLLYADFYTPYCVEPGMFSKDREQFYRSNMINVRYLDENGRWYDQPYLLLDELQFFPLERVSTGTYGMIDMLIERDMQKIKPLKASFSKVNGVPDYVAYTGECRKLEQNRTIYTIKLDVPLPFVDGEILVRCARSGASGDLGIGADAFERLLGDLYDVHVKRYENYFTKKRHSHTIFSRMAMEHFARVGRQTDHFFALRPYTPQERVQILTHLRDQAKDNPYFHVYFFKDGFAAPVPEIALYEGAGTLIAKPFTNYDLAGDHAEAIITQEAFCSRFKAFFTGDLLERYVTDQEETLRVFDDLIAIAKECA